MARLSQADVKAKADEWARLDGEIGKLEKKRDADLQPHLAAYEEAIAPVTKKYQGKIEALVNVRRGLEDQVLDWLQQHGKPIVLAGDLTVAANEVQTSSRKVDAKTFFDKIKDRSADFWSCVSIGIQKADKYLGKDKVDSLATTDSKLVAVLKLK